MKKFNMILKRKRDTGITHKFICMILVIFVLLITGVMSVSAWSGGPGGSASTDPNKPSIGTHDLILNNAINMLPSEFKSKIDMVAADYGSELPDYNTTECKCTDGIGDMGKHHLYYKSDGTVQDAAAANRAQEEYNIAMSYLTIGDKHNFSEHVGMMSHYITDSAVFAHTMGSGTDWGNENISNHGHYEYYVNTRPGEFFSSSYIKFDGGWSNISAYDGALALARDTTFDNKFGNGLYTNVWVSEMLNNSGKVPPYAFANSAFKTRARQTINYSVNVLADVMYAMLSPKGDILSYYRGLGQSPNIAETTDLLKAADDWRSNIIPQGFFAPIATVQLLTLADEWIVS